MGGGAISYWTLTLVLWMSFETYQMYCDWRGFQAEMPTHYGRFFIWDYRSILWEGEYVQGISEMNTGNIIDVMKSFNGCQWCFSTLRTELHHYSLEMSNAVESRLIAVLLSSANAQESEIDSESKPSSTGLLKRVRKPMKNYRIRSKRGWSQTSAPRCWVGEQWIQTG